MFRKLEWFRAWGAWPRVFALALAAILVIGAPLPIASAQPASTSAPAKKPPADEPATPRTHPDNPSVWNTDQMMEDAVLQLTKRYNLTKEQEGFTRLLLKKRVREFLKSNESDIRELLKESIDFKLRLKKDSSAALKRWSERAMPLYEAAMDAIQTGNTEWGEILNDQQRLIHQQDLDQMVTSFGQARITLGRWKRGAALDGEMSDPKAQMEGWRQDRAQVGTGIVSQPVASIELKMEEQWQQYVNRFIVAYKLDEKQTASARGIHRDMLIQAQNYRTSTKELADVEAKLKNYKYDPKKPDALVVLRQKRHDLESPIRKMFLTLQQRLEDLLTNPQRTKIDISEKAMLETMARSLSGTATEPTPTPSKPPATQPAGPEKPKPTTTAPSLKAEPAKLEPPKDDPTSDVKKPKADESPSDRTDKPTDKKP